MKAKFTNTEIGSIASTIAGNANLTLRINRCGNVDVSHKDANEIHFVFRKGANGYSIRRLFGNYKGSEQKGGSIGKAYFATIKEATNYFSYYMDEKVEKLTD